MSNKYKDFKATALFSFEEVATGVGVAISIPYPVCPGETPVYDVLEALCKAGVLVVRSECQFMDAEGNILKADEFEELVDKFDAEYAETHGDVNIN